MTINFIVGSKTLGRSAVLLNILIIVSTIWGGELKGADNSCPVQEALVEWPILLKPFGYDWNRRIPPEKPDSPAGQQLAQKVADFLGITDRDPLYTIPRRYGALPVKGATVRFNESMLHVAKALVAFPNALPAFLDSRIMLVHGSLSGSLLGVSRRTSGLLPFGKLIDLPNVPPPYLGAFDGGIQQNGVNQTHLSTAFLSSLEQVLDRHSRYDLNSRTVEIQPGFSLEDAKKRLAVADGIVRKLLQRQIDFYPKLTPLEKKLIERPYPVLYGIRSNPKGEYSMVTSDFPQEIGVKGGVPWSDVTVVWVPSKQVDVVKMLFSKLDPPTPDIRSIEEFGPSP